MRPRELAIGFVLGLLTSAGFVVDYVANAAPIVGGTSDDDTAIQCFWVCG